MLTSTAAAHGAEATVAPASDLRRLAVRLSPGAAALGIAYAASPGGLVILFVLVGLVVAATRDMRGTERRWAWGVLATAIAARVVAIAAIAMSANPERQSFAALFGDSAYAISRSLWMRNTAVGISIASPDFFDAFDPAYGATAYNTVLAALHLLFGPSPYAAHLLSTLLFFAAVLVLFRFARASYGAAAALGGLAVLVFMPSLFVWTVSPLKEAPSAVTVAVAVAAVVAAIRAPRRGVRIVAPLVALVAVTAVRAVRQDAVWIVVAGLGLGFGLFVVSWKRPLILPALVVAVLAVGAIVGVPRVHDKVVASIAIAADRHNGHALAAGHFYRLLDASNYAPNNAPFDAADLGASARFLTRGVVRFITAPEPWILRPGRELTALPQQMLWYVLVVCGIYGVWYGLGRDRLLTSVLAGMVVASSMLIGPTSGNIGTLIRHRDSVMPWLAWLAGAGAVSVAAVLSMRLKRWNAIDLSTALLIALVVPVGFGAYWLFRTPPPRVVEIVPGEVAVAQRATLRGEHLRPFLRVFVIAAGGTFNRSQRDDWPPEAKYWLRTVNEAEIDVPNVPPGVYDLAIADNADVLATLPRAFTVVAPVAAASVPLVVKGRFLGLTPSEADRLRKTPGTTESWMDVIALDAPAADRRPINIGGPWVPAVVDGRVQVPATLRVRCALSGTECRAGGRAFAPGTELTLSMAGVQIPFAVDHVEGTVAGPLTPGKSVDVMARFHVLPAIAPLVHAGDRDRPVETAPVPVVAQVLRIARKSTVSGLTVLSAPYTGQRVEVPETLERLDVVLRVPAAIDGTSAYRGHRMAPGAPLTFETGDYAMSGTVIEVLGERGGQP